MKRRITLAASVAVAVFVVMAGAAFAATFVGTNDDDTIIGTGKNDRISGLKGDDTLFGRAGNDRILGGDNKDALFGGRGRDILIGGENSDRMSGGVGNDILFAADRQEDVANCGPGDSDRAVVDDKDIVVGCEIVSLVAD